MEGIYIYILYLVCKITFLVKISKKNAEFLDPIKLTITAKGRKGRYIFVIFI